MLKREVWETFLRECATDLMSGKLTTSDLRQALKNPLIRTHADHIDFRLAVVRMCEELEPTSTRYAALMSEIDAADRRWRKLLSAEPCLPEQRLRAAQ